MTITFDNTIRQLPLRSEHRNRPYGVVSQFLGKIGVVTVPGWHENWLRPVEVGKLLRSLSNILQSDLEAALAAELSGALAATSVVRVAETVLEDVDRAMRAQEFCQRDGCASGNDGKAKRHIVGYR